MSRTLMKHVRVLLVVVALVAMTLAILPGVANAAANLDGKVDAALNGDGGGTNKGDGGGDTNKSDGGADLEGKADGDLKGDVGTGDGGDNLGDTADRVLNSDTTADSVTDADQQVNLNDQPQVDGNTFSNTEVNNPAVPASGEVKADGNGELDGPVGVNEGVCVSGAVNESAGDCGGASSSLGDTVTPPDSNGNLGDTTANTDTTIDENVNPNEAGLDGTLDNTNDVVAPAVPASGTTELNGNAGVSNTLNQDVNSCTDLNAAGCDDNAAPAPDSGASIDLGDPIARLDDVTANHDATTDQQIGDDSLRSNGSTISNTDVDAPAIPASAKSELDANGNLGDTIDQDGSVCGSVNAAGCGDPAPAPGSEGNDIDLGDPVSGLDGTNVNSATTIDENVNPNNNPMLDGAANNTNDIFAPAVPASGTANLDGNTAEDDLSSQGVNSCTDLNAAGCGSDAAPDSGAGIGLDDPVADLGDTTANSDTTIDENVNPNEAGLDSTLDNTNDVVAPAVPASATAELNGNVSEGDTLTQDAAVCGTLNAAGCGGDAAASPDGGAGIDLGDPVANLGANAVPEGGATLGADTALSGDAATPADSDDVLSGDAGATLSGDVDTAPASNDAVTTISDSAALNSGAGSAPAGDDTTLGVDAAPSGDAALSSDAGATLSSDARTPADSGAAPSGDARTAPSGGAEPVPAGSDTVAASDDPSISLSDFLSDEVDTPLTGSDATLANGDSGTSLNSDAGTAPAGRNDESPGKLALADTATDTAAGSSGDPASTADPSDNGTQNLTTGPAKSRFRTLADSPFSGRSVALATGSFGGEGNASASSGSATKSGDRLLDTGGVSPLVLIAALLFIGSGILLVTKRRRFNS